MANPWTKKNPFLSLWMSGANAVAGRARSAGAAEISRQQTELTKAATRYWTDAWFGTPKSQPKSKRKSR